MADVIFFEKTGCAGNARQKQLLIAAGHRLEVHDLRQHFWSNVRLLEFFADLPVAQWFQRSAPAIRSGVIAPEELDPPTALALLRQNPLLIRRPLLQVGKERRVGFDAAAIDAWIGLHEIPPGELESCRQQVCRDTRIFYVQSAGGAAFPCRCRSEPAHASVCQP